MPGFSQLRIFNGHPCAITLESNLGNITLNPLTHFVRKDLAVKDFGNFTYNLSGDCVEWKRDTIVIEDGVAISYFLTINMTYAYQDNVDKSKTGFPVVR